MLIIMTTTTKKKNNNHAFIAAGLYWLKLHCQCSIGVKSTYIFLRGFSRKIQDSQWQSLYHNSDTSYLNCIYGIFNFFFHLPFMLVFPFVIYCCFFINGFVITFFIMLLLFRFIHSLFDFGNLFLVVFFSCLFLLFILCFTTIIINCIVYILFVVVDIYYSPHFVVKQTG